MKIVLIGQAGVGKTTIGKALSESIGSSFIDLDYYIQDYAGESIQELFAVGNEDRFRELEEHLLPIAMANYDIVSTGGGVVSSIINRNIISQAEIIIWLDADVDVICKRIADDSVRPKFIKNIRSRVEVSKIRRTSLFEGLATIKVDTSNKPVDDIVRELIGCLLEIGFKKNEYRS